MAASAALPVLARLRDEIGEPVELAFRRQGHPWHLLPWAVAAKAEVWLDRGTGILPAKGESSMTALGKALVAPGPLDRTQLLDLAALHDAEPVVGALRTIMAREDEEPGVTDRKSTRLNSSHEWISRMPSSA